MSHGFYLILHFVMRIVHTSAELDAMLLAEREAGHSIGFVPTMGALHEGHLSLVRRSAQENTLTVVSIFLNPTQFNDPKDFERYPRTLDADCQMLGTVGDPACVVVYAPEVSDVYPTLGDLPTFSYPPTDEVMEGARRPGHFNGVCQVVSRLFELVRPDRAYFGEKDFQQIAVIRRLVSDKGYPITIVPCPVVRETTGLAMSSRNTLLTDEERAIAPAIYRTLRQSLALVGQKSVAQTEAWVVDSINAVEGLSVEYFCIVDGRTLAQVSSWDETADIVGCITVYCGCTPIRLIDHIRYK